MLTLLVDPRYAARQAERARKRGTTEYARQPARQRHHDYSDVVAGYSTTARAVAWFAPWRDKHYPGRLRLLRGVWSVTRHAVWRWCHEITPLPEWAALAMAAAIEARCVVGMALVGELRAHAAAMALRPKAGAHLRRARAAGVGPAGLGARGEMAGERGGG